MNDSKDETPHLITRRTIAKTAAWAAPAIAVAVASPAHAASTPQVAAIRFDYDSYDVAVGETIRIEGTLVPAKGASVPADFRFNVTVPGAKGYSWSAPVVMGDRFWMELTAYDQASNPATLWVSSPNYSSYLRGETTINVVGAGAILLGQPSYDITQNGVSVRGTLEAPQGGTVPADIQLVASTTDGFEVLIQPLVTGNTYELIVRATGATGATGTLTVSSSSHPAYKPGTAALTANVDGPVAGPQLVFDEPYFLTSGGASVAVTGKVILPPGMTLPPDFTLLAQSASGEWKIIGNPVMTGPDTFSIVITPPKRQAITYIFLYSPTHQDYGTPITWVANM